MSKTGMKLSMINLKKGQMHLILEDKPRLAAAIFMRYVRKSQEAICISRFSPEILKRDYGVSGVKTLWLTSNVGIDHISPTSLGNLTSMLVNYIHATKEPVILFHGIEYLTIHNEFTMVIRMISYIDDIVMKENAILILSADPNAFTKKEFSLIKHEAHVIIDGNAIQLENKN